MPGSNSRYSGPPTVLYSYTNEFSVECPRCKLEALVTSDKTSPRETGKLTCRNCMHAEKVSDLIRYKAIVKRHCDECGEFFETEISNQREKVREIAIPCPHCGRSHTYNPKNEEYINGYKTVGRAADPLFGLPLWFQADVRGNLLWALNREHLNEIRSYVISKLRERQTHTHTTMVERLPHFIKDAKNRALIIKVIERLERKSVA